MEQTHKVSIIRYIYLYLITAISIVLIIIAAVQAINLVLREYVFQVKDWNAFEDYYECSDDTLFYTYDTKGTRVKKDLNLSEEATKAQKDECIIKTKEKRELQHNNDLKREMITWLSMLIVALPLYIYHWGIIKKEARK